MRRSTWMMVALLALVIVAGAAALAACGSSGTTTDSSASASASAAAGGTYKVGFVTSKTGVSAVLDPSITGSTEAAVGFINSQGGIDGKWQIDMLSKDDGSDVAKASAAVTQLIQQDKVDFILQPWVDFIAPVARGICEKAGMPEVVSDHPSKKDAAIKYYWTFSNTQGAEDNGDALAKVFQQMGWKTVVAAADVLTIQRESMDWAAEKAKPLGINVVPLSTQWTLDQTDFSGVASQIVADCDKNNADALLLLVTAPQADAMMKALKGAGLEIPVIGGPALAIEPALFASGTKNVEGMYFVSTAVNAGSQLPDDYPAKAQVVAYYDAVKKASGFGPDNFGAWASDAVSLMAEAVKRAGSTDKQKVRDAFESITGFWGLTGQFNYSATDHVGNHGGEWLYQVKNGAFKLIGDKPIN
jgi:branched-chain amino acid transport system substrate-binding protein